MTPSCQRCPPEEGIYAEYKVQMRNADTGETIRFWYVCGVHLEEDFKPWLTPKVRSSMTSSRSPGG